MLSESTLALTEDGDIGSYTMRLNKAPSGNVWVRVSRNGDAAAQHRSPPHLGPGNHTQAGTAEHQVALYGHLGW